MPRCRLWQSAEGICRLVAQAIDSGLYFPPGPDYWKKAFGTWDGLMMPWCPGLCFQRAVAVWAPISCISTTP
ncbi:hypothetical protein AK812_SmicGene1225 [Symbiodinium microadriaticum]|uniref:Uncharacterized protein n=1 Tax=Symbiodinium microadriaticum TaxID=2951 RepID=A0A1Q9F4L2_SYMMI|nr:hypothetical protein AK812_SmicGene1225 [Symbiodinium microadriaticum]